MLKCVLVVTPPLDGPVNLRRIVHSEIALALAGLDGTTTKPSRQIPRFASGSGPSSGRQLFVSLIAIVSPEPYKDPDRTGGGGID